MASVCFGRPVRLESLEGRTLLSMAFLGDEFQANTRTAFDQGGPEIAMDDGGSFVVVWTDGTLEFSDQDVYARRYNAAGQPQGSEFRVHNSTTNRQLTPAVAMEPDGDFIVVWADSYAGYEIYARMYDSAGTPKTGELHINQQTADGQFVPSVAFDPDGGFIVTWLDRPSGGDGSYHVRARRFDSTGVPLGDDFEVVDPASGDQRDAVVAIDDQGDFVIAWSEYDRFGPKGVFARRYDSDGDAIGESFQIDDGTDEVFRGTTLAMQGDGSFIVTWSSVVDDVVAWEIFAHRYDEAGAARGEPFKVSTFTTHAQSDPTLAVEADGDFLIAWQSMFQDGNQAAVVARAFTADGLPDGAEFVVNTYTPDAQGGPDVAMTAAGQGVFVWHSSQQDGSRLGVYGQRFDNSVETASLDDGTLVVHGTPGNDVITLSLDGSELRVVVNGAEFVFDASEVDRAEVYADKGNDSVSIEPGVLGTYVLGGLGNDTLTGGDGADSLVGASGGDSLRGGAGNDRVAGGKHTDILFAEEGDDRVYGDEGADQMDGGLGRDRMYGGADNDTMLGGNQNDTMYGEAGSDSLHGGNHSDRLFPGPGPDTADGGAGDDNLFDVDGSIDNLIGGAGVDGHDSDANDLISLFEFEL